MEVFDPTRSLVFLLHGNGAPEGAGFLVSRRHILTCCHVIEAVQRAGNVSVEFPLLDGRPNLQAREKRRYPYMKGSSFGHLHDIALLELARGQSLPRDAEPVLLSRLSENEMSDAPVEMYGFPDDLERDHWVKGTIRRRVRDARIQIDHDPGARTG